MNQVIMNIMIVYSIASIVYVCYIVYLKVAHKESERTVEEVEKYNMVKKTRTTVFILGILCGLIFLIISEPYTTVIKSSINTVSNISDISVM